MPPLGEPNGPQRAQAGAPWGPRMKKQNQRKAIDIEIKRLIREAIAASNKASENNKKNTFKLTPEAKLIATNFKANKGRLPWPLEKGVVIQGFGRQRHPVVKTATIQSN